MKSRCYFPTRYSNKVFGKNRCVHVFREFVDVENDVYVWKRQDTCIVKNISAHIFLSDLTKPWRIPTIIEQVKAFHTLEALSDKYGGD